LGKFTDKKQRVRRHKTNAVEKKKGEWDGKATMRAKGSPSLELLVRLGLCQLAKDILKTAALERRVERDGNPKPAGGGGGTLI
jgi:hypothetical protein